ncbi:MAG: tetratricopeptide repeat protein [bacterium]
MRRWEWAVLTAALLFSLSLGVANLVQYMDTPLFTVPFTDEESYVNWAKKIVEGKPVGVFYQDPLYPYFLALVFKITGVPETGMDHPAWLVIRILQVLMGTGAAALVFYAARKLAGPAAAAAALLLFSLYQGLYFYELLLLKTCLATLASAGVLAAGVACASSAYRKPRWLLLGVLIGTAALLRGNFLAFVPFAMAWAVFLLWRDWKKGLVRAALIIAGAALAVSPATVHNLRKGDLVITTSQAGPNFYIGNNPIADGAYVKLPFQESAHPRYEARDFKKEAAERKGEDLTPSEVSRYWLREGMDWMAQNPGRALELYGYKLLLMVHRYEIPDNQSFYLVRENLVPSLWICFLSLGMLWAPALAGFIAVGFSDRRWLFVALLLMVYLLTAAMFYVLSRYRLALTPALAVLAGGYLVWLGRKAREKSALKIIASLAAAALVLVAAYWPVEKENEFQAYNIMGIAHVRSAHPVKSIPYFVKALEMKPGKKSVQKNLRIAIDLLPPEPPMILELAGKWQSRDKKRIAALLYEKALMLNPELYKVRLHLAKLYGPEMGEYKESLYHLKKALEQKPSDSALMVMIGNCHYELDNPELAREWWRKALAIDPDNQDARQNLEVLENKRPR